MEGKSSGLTTFNSMNTTEIRLESVESTMDEAKNIASSQDFLLVTAMQQTRGKGTRGRFWSSCNGNIHMTVGIHRRYLPAQRLALLPLEMGLHVWEETAGHISSHNRPNLALKWPNDLFYKGNKVAGILIESHKDFFMVGIGINIVASPTINDGGAPSACLVDAGMLPEAVGTCIEGIYQRIMAVMPIPDTQLADSDFIDSGYSAETILLNWQAKVDWNRWHRMRDRAGQPLVKPVSVNQQGHLQVSHTDGSREWLVAEYLV